MLHTLEVQNLDFLQPSASQGLTGQWTGCVFALSHADAAASSLGWFVTNCAPILLCSSGLGVNAALQMLQEILLLGMVS